MSVVVYGGSGALGRVVVNQFKDSFKVVSIDLCRGHRVVSYVIGYKL